MNLSGSTVKNLRYGDWVVYRKSKISKTPGNRARGVRPSHHGDTYSYHVDKYWAFVREKNGVFELVTRTGKRNFISREDELLRRPNLLEMLFMSRRFPQMDQLNLSSPRHTTSQSS